MNCKKETDSLDYAPTSKSFPFIKQLFYKHKDTSQEYEISFAQSIFESVCMHRKMSL